MPIFEFVLVWISLTGTLVFLKSLVVFPIEYASPESLGGTQLLCTPVLYF